MPDPRPLTNVNAVGSPWTVGTTKGANAYNIFLTKKDSPGNTHVHNIQEESATRASGLLMLNHARHHTYFHRAGLHNHIVHHLLTIYALGATPEQIQQMYDLNRKYQLPQIVHSPDIAIDFINPGVFQKHLGRQSYYRDFLTFFKWEIEKKGVIEVVNEYVFKGDERADDFLGRMFSGFEHPLLHLGFGIEFKQPCIVAESLAQGAIHDDWPLKILFQAEEMAKGTKSSSGMPILWIADQLRNDPVVSKAVRNDDPPNKITHGLIPRALNELIPHLAQFTVKPEQLQQKTAEMIHACAYLSGTAQHPKKVEMIEFFMMHSTNLSIFFSTFLNADWIEERVKCRLLEWKVRMDLTMYAACKTPMLYPERVAKYRPKSPGGWGEIFSRVCSYRDDGHTSKFVRALKNAEAVSTPYLGQKGFPLQKQDFLQIAHMTLDSVDRMDDPGYKLPDSAVKLYIEQNVLDEEAVRIIVRFVRWCGLEEAWDHVPNLVVGTKL